MNIEQEELLQMNRKKSNVIQFPRRASRAMAFRWLIHHHTGFPDLTGCTNGPLTYGGWRFVLLDSGETIFADCIQPCITKDDYFAELQRQSRELTKAVGEERGRG